MKTFVLTIFKGHEIKQEKVVTASSREELKAKKEGFWNESPYRRPMCWMGVKRV